jgi:hypothetical protein
MSWLNVLRDLTDRYAGNANEHSTENAHEDFQQVVRSAPQDVVANGIAHMFRSDQTPAFSELISLLFSQSNQNQKAGLLGHLLSSAEPGALAGLPGLGNLAGLRGGTENSEQILATQLSPEQVEQIATHVEGRDPSIVDRISEFYSQHPGVMKAVGGMALSIAIQHMTGKRAA